MTTKTEIKQDLDHIVNQNDVIVSTLIKILEAIDSKEIQGIRIALQEKILN